MASDVATLIGTAVIEAPTTRPTAIGQVATNDTDGSFVGWVTVGSPDLDPITLDAVNNRVGINNATPSHALDVTGTARVAGPSLGVSLFVANNTAIRGTAASGGTLYIDASTNTTGTINLRATTTVVSGAFSVGSLSTTNGNVTANGTNSPTVSAIGNGIPGFRIQDNDAGGKNWAIEQARNGPAGTLEFTNLTDASAVPRMSIRADGKVIMPALPTSDPVIAGALWNDAGTLKISAG